MRACYLRLLLLQCSDPCMWLLGSGVRQGMPREVPSGPSPPSFVLIRRSFFSLKGSSGGGSLVPFHMAPKSVKCTCKDL